MTQKSFFLQLTKFTMRISNFNKILIAPTIQQVKPVNVYESIYRLLRYQKIATKILGRKYTRSKCFIQIDITYECNLNCYNCDRSCRQAPTKENITVDQIEYFVKESIDNNIKWERICILGGEPTLHPELFTILNILLDYKNNFSPESRIRLVTNGCSAKVKNVLKKIPKEIKIDNSGKISNLQTFCLYNRAPQDIFLYRNLDFTNGCWITSLCGIGLTPYGYYPCAAGGAIDRIFGFDIGRKELPHHNDDLLDQLHRLCKLCGHFISMYGRKENITETWKSAYNQYKTEKPVLTRYRK